MEYRLDARLIRKRVTIDLIGVGGNGAQMATRLARLDQAMRDHGHPYGLHVRAFDAGMVREANIGRQAFSPADIGQYKALVTVNRINQFYGLDWDAYPCAAQEYWESESRWASPDIVVSCVDTREARRSIHHVLAENASGSALWLDLGNTERGGQVVLGTPNRRPWPAGYSEANPRLPVVTELFPQLLDEAIPDDNAPSCSAKISLASQGLYVNDFAAVLAAQHLYELFSEGRIKTHGALFDIKAKRCAPMPIDPEFWKGFGLALPTAAIAPASMAA